jgi:hypothetical protein
MKARSVEREGAKSTMRDIPLSEFNGEARRRCDSGGEHYSPADAPSPVNKGWSDSSKSYEDEEQALLWEAPINPVVNRRVNIAEPLPSMATLSCIPRVFRASWPSAWDRSMHIIRPAMDIYVLLSMIIFALSPNVTQDSSALWAIYRGNSLLCLWLPFTIRFCHGLLHLLISIAILPGPLLYHEGPLLRFYPKWLLENLKESQMFREMHRPRLQQAGGISVQLVCPDGVTIDAMYFKGNGASVDGPTAIRFNGNAEAFELQVASSSIPSLYPTIFRISTSIPTA